MCGVGVGFRRSATAPQASTLGYGLDKATELDLTVDRVQRAIPAESIPFVCAYPATEMGVHALVNDADGPAAVPKSQKASAAAPGVVHCALKTWCLQKRSERWWSPVPVPAFGEPIRPAARFTLPIPPLDREHGPAKAA